MLPCGRELSSHGLRLVETYLQTNTWVAVGLLSKTHKNMIQYIGISQQMCMQLELSRQFPCYQLMKNTNDVQIGVSV